MIITFYFNPTKIIGIHSFSKRTCYPELQTTNPSLFPRLQRTPSSLGEWNGGLSPACLLLRTPTWRCTGGAWRRWSLFGCGKWRPCGLWTRAAEGTVKPAAYLLSLRPSSRNCWGWVMGHVLLRLHDAWFAFGIKHWWFWRLPACLRDASPAIPNHLRT